MENFRIKIVGLGGRERDSRFPRKKREEKGIVDELKKRKGETVGGLLLHSMNILFLFFFLLAKLTFAIEMVCNFFLSCFF